MFFKRSLLIGLLLVICLPKLLAQQKIEAVYLETGNAVSAFPFVGAPQLFYTNFHPYVTVGARMVWREKNKHAWEQAFNIGYVYHRFIHHNIPLFTETVYRLNAGTKLEFRVHLGIGYLHNIPAMDRFELNDQGEYEKIRNFGRAQGMAKFSISGAYKLNDAYRLSLNYGVLGQTPYVKSYVPLLPYNTIQLGVQKSLVKSTSANPYRKK